MKKLFTLLLLLIPIVTAQETIPIPIIGKISLELPIPVLGAILGFFDGALNPCALSVLFFLIAYLMSLGSRKKSLMLGLVYCTMVFIFYSLFMYGVSSIFSIIGYLYAIKMIAGGIILLAGLIEVKDFFFYGKWFSLEIPKFAKPRIERLVGMATIPSAILLGIFVSFVEIPCAGAFPFAYVAILAERVTGITNLFYILWYNLFFILPLVLLTLIFNLGLIRVEKAEKTRRKTRKYMRLIAGLMMIILGTAFLRGVI